MAVAVLLSVRYALGGPGLLEVVADGILKYVPVAVFDVVLGALGPLAKGLLYAAIALGVIFLGGLLGVLLAPRIGRIAERRAALLLALVALLLAEAIVLPLAQAGAFGVSLVPAPNPLVFHGPLILAALAYGVTVAALLRPAVAPSAGTSGADGHVAPLPRRAFLRQLLVVLGLGSLVAVGVSSANRLVEVAAPRRAAVPPASFDASGFGPTPAVTPVEAFYQVNKGFLSTQVDGAAWRLVIDGLVDRPQSLSLDQLRALPSLQAYRTLECISFVIVEGDDLIGNQLWRGIRLSDLLERVGVRPEARFILWEAADGYTESLPIEIARHPDSWIAYEMGGAPLTAEHGFPARVLIPGRFGMKQPKWLTRIQLADHDEPGYWQQRGWDRDAVVRVMSRIDHPAPRAEVPARVPFPVFGVANSGDRGISRVEVSPDDGATWVGAALEPLSDPLGPLTWVRWRADVTLAAEGPARLVVRATDGRGGAQDGRETAPLPSGSTGWHAVRVTARLPAA